MSDKLRVVLNYVKILFRFKLKATKEDLNYEQT